MVEIVIVLVLVGILLWGLSSAPFIDAQLKVFIRWGVLLVAAVWIVVRLAAMLGHPVHL